MEKSSVMCACGHCVCNRCFMQEPDKTKEVMARLHAPKSGLHSDKIMKEYAHAWLDAKTDFERDNCRFKAYTGACELASDVAKSGIKREMEKLRLIKIFDEARKVRA